MASTAVACAYRCVQFGLYDTLKPIMLTGSSFAESFFASFLLGYAVSLTAGLISYPIDTIWRRMFYALPQVSHQSMFACFRSIMKHEGASSLFKGAGAHKQRSLLGAGMLACFDKLGLIYLQFNAS